MSVENSRNNTPRNIKTNEGTQTEIGSFLLKIKLAAIKQMPQMITMTGQICVRVHGMVPVSQMRTRKLLSRRLIPRNVNQKFFLIARATYRKTAPEIRIVSGVTSSTPLNESVTRQIRRKAPARIQKIPSASIILRVLSLNLAIAIEYNRLQVLPIRNKNDKIRYAF